MAVNSLAGRYTLYTCNRDNSIVGEMEGAVLNSATWTLNGPGSIKYDIGTLQRAASYPIECVNEVMLRVDEKWMHQAIHLKSVGTPSVATFDCPGLLEYFNYRFILNGSLVYSAVDQCGIAGDLVYQSQNLLPGMNWNIVVDSYTNSGVVRSLKYERDQHQNVLDVLKQFTTYADAVGNPTGFDFSINDKGDNKRYFKMSYPRKGVTQTNIVLEWKRNIVDYKLSVDGSKMANRVYVTGGTSGDVKFENNFQDNTSRAAYGEWQSVEHAGSENDVNTLYALAARQVAKRKAPVKIPDITVVEVPDSLLGVLQTGDLVKVIIDNGRDQFNGYLRIIEITWKPGPGNLNLKMADPLV